MIKVLQLFGEPITYGGQESVVYNMISSCKLDNFFYFELFTPYYVDNKNIIDLMKDLGSKIHSLGIKFKTGNNRFRLIKQIKQFISKHNDFDCYHIHTGSLTTMVMYSYVIKKYCPNAKIITHAHTSSDNESFIHKLLKIIYSILLSKNVDCFIACSKKAAMFEYSKSVVKKTLIVNNGIEINKFEFNNIERTKLINKYNLNNKFVIGNIARYTSEKNHFFMLSVFRELLKQDKNSYLVLIGDGELKDKIIELSKEYNIYNNILFIDNSSSINKFYNMFDVFILPSIYEGLPVVAIEAQINGLPTLLSDKVSLDAKISSGTEFLSIDRVDNWVSKILEIKSNSKSLRNNYSIDKKMFDRDYTYKLIGEIYNK